MFEIRVVGLFRMKDPESLEHGPSFLGALTEVAAPDHRHLYRPLRH